MKHFYNQIKVDSTIAELLFEIKCNALRSFVIYNPRYRQHRDISTLVATSDNHLYSIQDVEPGNWQVIVDCDNDFYVEVRGQSPVDFRFTFASSNDQFKVGFPRAQKFQFFMVRVSTPKIQKFLWLGSPHQKFKKFYG